MALKETLSGALSGLAKSIGNAGKGVYGAIGNGVAAVGDLGESIFTGKATTRRQDDFIKDLYKTDDVKDAMLKQAGTSLDAASTIADLLPGTSNPIVNSVQGALSAFGDEYATYGKDADLGQALKNAGVGAASSAIGGKIGGAIAGKTASKIGGKIGEFANSTLGRGAITGATSGATAGGLSSALNGGSLTDVLGNTVAGAGSGAVSGATTAGIYGVGNKVANKVDNKIRSNWNTQTPVADVETAAPKRTVAPIEDETFEIIDITDNNGPVPVRRRINVQGANESDGAVDIARRQTRPTTEGIEGISRNRTLPDATEQLNNRRLQFGGTDFADDLVKGDVADDLVEALYSKDKATRKDAMDVFGLKEKDVKDIKSALREKRNYDQESELNSDYSDSSLPKLSLDEWRTHFGEPEEGFKKKYLRKNGMSLMSNALGETSDTLRSGGEGGAMNADYDRIRELYENAYNRPRSNDSYTGNDLIEALAYDERIGDKGLNKRLTERQYQSLYPSQKIEVQDGGSKARNIKVENNQNVINDITPRTAPEVMPQPEIRVEQQTAQSRPQNIATEQPRTNNVMTGADDWGNPQQAKSNALSRALKNTGSELMTAQTNITRAERKRLGIDNAGDVVNNVRKRTGISDINDQADFARLITGAGDDSIMDTIQTVRMAKNPKKLTVDDYAKIVDETLDSGWKKASMGDSAKREEFRNNVVDDLRNQDPITAANWLKDLAASERAVAMGNSEGAPKAKEKAKLYTELANKMDKLSYDAVPQNEVTRMFDDTVAEFRARAEDYKDTNPKYAKAFDKLATQLENTPKTIQNYRSFKKDFVKSAQVARISAGAKSGSLQAGLTKNNIRNKIANTFLEEPTNRLLARAGGVAYDLGTKLENTNFKNPKESFGEAVKATMGEGLSPAMEQRAINMAARQTSRENLYGQEPSQEDIVNAQLFGNGGQDTTAGLGGQSQITIPEGIRSSGDAATDAIIATAYDGTYTKNPAQLIRNAMELALAAGDIDTYNSFAETYKDALELYPEEEETSAQSNGLDSLSDKQIENINKIESAEASIDQLEELFNKAGGAKGVIGGRIANMTASAGMNSDVATYNQIAKGLINQIAAATGKTDTLNTEGEVKRALDLIPAFTDTKETAQAKLTALRQMLATNKQNMYSNYGVEQ